MNTSLLARGGFPVQMDRERIVFFNMQSTGLLFRKYGRTFWRELYEKTEAGEEVPNVAALQFFLWVGLQTDAESEGDQLTPEKIAEYIRPMTVSPLMNAVTFALSFTFEQPVAEGKAEAVAASPADAATGGPGQPTASTTAKPKASRSASSSGRPPRSSKPPSRK